MRRVAAIALVLALVVPTVAAQDPNPDVDTWTDATWDMTFQEIDVIDVQGVVRVHEGTFEGGVRTADEIRDLHDDAEASGDHAQFHADAESTVAARAESSLEALVQDGDATVHDVNLVNATLEDEPGTDAYHPSVDFEVDATIDVVLDPDAPDEETRQKLDDALKMGATMPLDIDLTAPPGRNRTFRVELPDNARALRDASEPFVVDIDNWKGDQDRTQALGLTVTGADATVFREQEGVVDVRVDLRDLAVDVLGGSGTVDADIRATAEIGAVEVPTSLRRDLPDRIRLNAVGADGLRYAVQEGYVTDDTLEQARQEFANRSRSAIQAAFGPDTATDVEFDRSTIEGGIQGTNDDTPPVRLVATAQAQREFGGLGGSALVVTSLDQQFAVSAFEPFDTSYEIVLPQGLTAEDVRLDGTGQASETTVDDREAARIDMAGDAGEGTVTMTVGVTLMGLLAASPLLMAIAVILLLIVILLIVYAAWRILRDDDRRRRRRYGEAEAAGTGRGEAGDGDQAEGGAPSGEGGDETGDGDGGEGEDGGGGGDDSSRQH